MSIGPDRTLISMNCLNLFPACVMHVGMRLLSDHNSLTIKLDIERRRAKVQFKFFNQLTTHPNLTS